MKVSGNSTSCVPFLATSAASSAIRSIVAARSKRTGSAWAQATVTGSRMLRRRLRCRLRDARVQPVRPSEMTGRLDLIVSDMPGIVAASATHAQDRAHAELRVVRHRAPQPVAAGEEPQRERRPPAGARQRETVGPRAADPAEAQVVDVPPVVLELNQHAARLDRGAREDEVELARTDAESPRRRLRGGREDGEGGDCYERGADHLSSAVRANEEAPGMTAAASALSHCSSSEQ